MLLVHPLSLLSWKHLSSAHHGHDVQIQRSTPAGARSLDRFALLRGIALRLPVLPQPSSPRTPMYAADGRKEDDCHSTSRQFACGHLPVFCPCHSLHCTTLRASDHRDHVFRRPRLPQGRSWRSLTWPIGLPIAVFRSTRNSGASKTSLAPSPQNGAGHTANQIAKRRLCKPTMQRRHTLASGLGPGRRQPRTRGTLTGRPPPGGVV